MTQSDSYRGIGKKNVSGDTISEDGHSRHVCISQKLQINIHFSVPRPALTDTQHTRTQPEGSGVSAQNKNVPSVCVCVNTLHNLIICILATELKNQAFLLR